MSKVIEIRNVTAAYGENEVLRQVSMTVNQGEFIVIIGPSGCGKTTLLKMINGLVAPAEGEVLVHGELLSECNPGCFRILRWRIISVMSRVLRGSWQKKKNIF